MQAFFHLVARLPLRFLRTVGSIAGGLVYRCAPTYRRRIRENMSLAGYDDETLARRVSRNAGRQALESLWVWYRSPEEVMPRVTVDEETFRIIGDAMRSKRPIVFMTPHVGCFEVLPVWLADVFFEETGRNITILYRPPKKAFLRRLVGEARRAPGIEPVPTDLSGVKCVIRNLRAGHTFGALPDQVPSQGEGAWADFFGRPAFTMTLPLRVARQFDALRIFAWGARTKDGWRVEAQCWDEPLTGDLETDARAMNRAIEGIIRRMPEQYAWSYNRYKVPRGTLPAHVRKESDS